MSDILRSKYDEHDDQSSFEHQKTAPERVGSKPLGSPADTPITCPTPSKPMSPYSLSDDSHIPMDDVPRSYRLQDWDKKPPPCTPPPVNIERTRGINDSTTATNKVWRDELRKNGSVRQYYRLVLTQWSTARSCPNWGCGDPGFTVPGNGTLPASAVANVTMETWLQDDPSIASRRQGAPPRLAAWPVITKSPHCQLAHAIGRVARDRRQEIGKDPRHRREISGAVAHRSNEGEGSAMLESKAGKHRSPPPY
jgi:hypothetical protein